MTVRSVHTMSCDVPQCTTSPVTLKYQTDLPSGWSRGRMSVIGSWSGTPVTQGAHFCPQHRRLSRDVLDLTPRPQGEDS